MKIRTANDPQYRRLMALRENAQTRGMHDLAVVYGWMLIRLGQEMIEQNNVVLLHKFGPEGSVSRTHEVDI